MPLLKKLPKGHLSQSKNGFKIPYADHKHKIKDIIDNKLNEPVAKKAYHEFVEKLSQEKYEERSSSPKEIYTQIEENKENLRRKTNVSRKNIKEKKKGYENEPKNKKRKLSFDTDDSLSQEELNKSEIKTAYVEFMSNSLADERNSLIIYKSSEGLVEDILETLQNGKSKIDSEEKVPKKKNKVEVKKKSVTKKKSKDRKRTGATVETSVSDDEEFAGLTNEEKMQIIYSKRNVGLYVLCDKCNKARYLPHIVDPLDLPEKWYCNMNPDKKHNQCSDPEHVKEDPSFLIHNLYNSGSIVFVKMDGYPWWPAMVEDDVDTETYFWLEGQSMKPTFYHVTFFDSTEVTRAWIRTGNIQPFMKNLDKPQFRLSEKHKYKSRMNVAVKQAIDAAHLPLMDRLKTYGFLKRYKKSSKHSKKPKSKENPNKKHKELSPLSDDDMTAILNNINVSDMSFNFLD